jgi:ABC-2 type transport system permease protein
MTTDAIPSAGGGPAAPAPGLTTGMFRVFDLAIGQMLWSRRTIFMALVVGLPVVVAMAVRALVEAGVPLTRVGRETIDGTVLFGLMMWAFFVRFAVPLLAMFYGTSLVADEVEDKTITYLFTRPIPRGAVLVGKYIAYLACTAFVVLPSLVVVYLLVVPMRGSLGAAFPDLLKDLLLLGLGLAVFGAVFAFVGAKFKRPLLIGLIFVFVWEQFVLAVPGYLKQFTVMFYLQAIVPHAMPADGLLSLAQGLFRQTPSLPVSLMWLAVIWAVALWLATRIVARREYVLEQ